MRIIIYGELIQDKYYYTTTNRMAPEANIPVYLASNTELKLGGATNVALNLSSFCDIEFISVIGNDIDISEIEKIFDKNNIKYNFFKENRKSIIKNRIICNNLISTRFDIEDTFDINKNTQNNIYEHILSKINNLDGIIISDYNKGIIPTELCKNIISLANLNNVSIFIDPKVNNIDKYKNCTFFKPNMKEAIELLNDNSIINKEEIIKKLFSKINCKYLLVTDNENGMIGYEHNNLINVKHENNIKVIDVTGAGDTVISVFVYIYLLTNDFIYAINISNYIAGKSVQHLGNYRFRIEDIKEYNKIIYSHQSDILKNISKIHKNIVFTNGCFDIIHIGHLKLLNYCKTLGDILVLGINSDSSIKKLKGENRPINCIEDRVKFLDLLNIVDYIVIFDELTPIEILKNLKPTFLVKGGDYTVENVIGKEYVNKVIICDLVPDKSTTNIIKKINFNI